MKRIAPFVFAVLIVLGWGVLAQACPMCKDSIPNSDAQHQGGVPVGINQSVYLMLGVFFTMVGSLSWLIVKTVRSTPVLPPRAGGFPIKKDKP